MESPLTKMEYSDPLFIAGIRSWLGDIPYADPQLSLEQLEAVLEAQREWSAPGDKLLKEMKLVLATIRRAVAKGRPHARLARARTLRAFERAGVPSNLLSEPHDKYQNPPVAPETAVPVAKPKGGLRWQERVFPEGTAAGAPGEQRGMKGK